MSNGRTDLFVYLAAAFATIIGLFALQKWYGSYIDMRYNAHLAEAGPYENVLNARQASKNTLEHGKLPIEQAIARISERGRSAFASIAPQPSQDISALSGWIHRPGFKPATGFAVFTPRPVVARPAEPPPEAAAPPAAAEPSSAVKANKPAGPAATQPNAAQPHPAHKSKPRAH